MYYGVVALDPAQFVVEDGGGGGDGGGKGKAVILPAVLSIGFNPFYKNTVRSVVCSVLLCRKKGGCMLIEQTQEIHIMRSLTSSSAPEEEGKGGEGQVKFHKMADFYSTKLNLLILGYIRPEYDYVSVEALIEDIRIDCEVARRSLLREAYICYLQDRGTGTDAVKEQREWLVRF